MITPKVDGQESDAARSYQDVWNPQLWSDVTPVKVIEGRQLIKNPYKQVYDIVRMVSLKFQAPTLTKDKDRENGIS